MKRISLFFHRLTHWEYWPFAIVYFPMYFAWLYYSIRSRTVFFFLPSNPSITNAGFLLESKKEIYDLLPKGSFPETILIKAGTNFCTIEKLRREKSIPFPCIAKPDIGMKGMAVEIIKNAEELEVYSQKITIDFLIQELISLPNELGIFYYRKPDERKGYISGIVKKEFLTIHGDGNSSVLELIYKEPRYSLQLAVLQNKYGPFLNSVLKKGEEINLVPFGNHARGAKFIDVTKWVDEELQQSIDYLCKQIPGFYYGRMDIRYNTLDELKQGKNFSIIELNGAGSEPTHIYDPQHSIFFAWKEILRHYRLLFTISKINNNAGFRHMRFSEGLRMIKENGKIVKQLSQFMSPG